MLLPPVRPFNGENETVVRGIYPAFELQDHLEARFKHPELHGCGKFHELEGPVYGVRDP